MKSAFFTFEYNIKSTKQDLKRTIDKKADSILKRIEVKFSLLQKYTDEVLIENYLKACGIKVLKIEINAFDSWIKRKLNAFDKTPDWVKSIKQEFGNDQQLIIKYQFLPVELKKLLFVVD